MLCRPPSPPPRSKPLSSPTKIFPPFSPSCFLRPPKNPLAWGFHCARSPRRGRRPPPPLDLATMSSRAVHSLPILASLLMLFLAAASASEFDHKIFEYNGSVVVTVATDFQRIFKIHDKLYVGLSGLATDVQTLYQRLVFRHKLYQLREERDMKPQTFASLVFVVLYEKRFGPYFCMPVIAGLGDDDVPFICTMDAIGANMISTMPPFDANAGAAKIRSANNKFMEYVEQINIE
ncbi:hypothetical protein Taro_043850, partial [Colocasia esculenta]|nr:hypothetical protein [Colocasia esculenta]